MYAIDVAVNKGAVVYVYNGSKKLGQATVNSKGKNTVKIKNRKKVLH